MAKSREAFRTISEVSDWLDTPAHVLRFWESRFNQIKPVKRAGGRRYYRPNDMALLGGIKRLLHDDGITIKGVQKILREKGVKYVCSLSLEDTGNTPERIVEKSAPPLVEETPIETILEESPVESEPELEVETTPVPEPAAINTGEEIEIREHIASIFADPDSGISLERAPEAEQTDAPTLEDETDTVSPVLEVADAPQTAVYAAETDIHTDIHEDRITALYHRLMALRDRLHTEMQLS